MKIEVLYFNGCPNHLPAAAERVRTVLGHEQVSAEVLEVTRATMRPSQRSSGSQAAAFAC